MFVIIVVMENPEGRKDKAGKNTNCNAKLRVVIQKVTPKTQRPKNGKDYVKRGLVCQIKIFPIVNAAVSYCYC